MASSGKLHLTIKNRERIIFDGEVKSLTSYNEKGKFDVLPQHANFISLIRKELVYRELDGKENKLELTKGIIKVKEDRMMVYLGIGV